MSWFTRVLHWLRPRRLPRPTSADERREWWERLERVSQRANELQLQVMQRGEGQRDGER